MGLIMIRCPRTGREISTGIRMSRREFEQLPVFFARAFCSTCQSEHEWFAKDAWVCDGAHEDTIPRAAAALRTDAGAPFDPINECAGRLLSGGGGKAIRRRHDRNAAAPT
jgi:hypothetical protein